MVPVEAQGRLAVHAGGVEVTQARGMPAHLGERVGFPPRPVASAVELEGLPSVPLASEHDSERLMDVSLLSGVAVTYGQVEGLLQMLGGLLVQA